MVEQYLQVLNKDLKFYKDSVIEVSKDIRREGFSDFPIFVASVFHNTLGEVILDAQEMGRTFTIAASTLEELVKQDIIPEEKSEFFKKNFKNPDDFACILMLTTKTQQFVFYPYSDVQPHQASEESFE